MQVYWSEQYTFDFSPYLRHIFTVKHIYLTLYIVCMCSTAPICSVPPALAVRAATWPCAPARARVCACACVRARARVCAGACVCAALASVVRVISFAYIVDSPAVLPRAGLAANFFEIVFKPSISVQLSSAGMGGTS